jgi:hypothetical protein
MMDREKVAAVLRKYVPPLAQSDVELISRDIAEMLETTRKAEAEAEPKAEPISKSRKLTGDKPRTNLVKPNKK